MDDKKSTNINDTDGQRRFKELLDDLREIDKKAKGRGGISAHLIPVKISKDSDDSPVIDDIIKQIIAEFKNPPTPENKILNCLPCLEETFAEISFSKGGGDILGDTGFLTIRTLMECIAIDIMNDNTDMSFRLLVTILKFCEMTGLLEIERFKDKYVDEIIERMV